MPLPTLSPRRRRAAGLVCGYLLDAALGDPQHGHPVAVFGSAASALEQRTYADSRAGGALTWGALVLPVVGLGVVLERAPFLATTAATFVALGGTSLVREGEVMTDLLAREDLSDARSRLSHLCSRPAAELTRSDLAGATVESLAENTSDAVVGPLVWGAIAGVPGLLGYRAVNTLDAMFGYRSERYLSFGWASARADDVANYLPARLCAGLTVALAPVVGGSPAAAVRAWREDAPDHPSPNAGPVEATAAGALGIRLGGAQTFDGVRVERAVLGDGPAPGLPDVTRAARLSRLVGAAALATAVSALLAGDRRRG